MSAVGLRSFRTDIQGMRAIAVMAVVAYHVWPAWLPGGYIGVDVFFVISGYLITGLLVRELERSGTIGLRDFYARRIRRLLPAASLTLLAVAVATAVWMSFADWRGVAGELVASALYVENLLLVQRQVDYLAQDAVPSPVQHFWSLSVEEQFYVFWPLVMLASAGLAKMRGWTLRPTLAITLAAICALSLGHAIHISFVDPAPGYFLTTTRVWELGLGGLLALVPLGTAFGARSRRALGWSGLLAIAVAAIFYSNRLPFPGYEALLPTLGACALLLARLETDDILGRWLASAPMQYLGAISYSLYLWHWPVIIFYSSATGRQAETLQDGVLVVAVSLLFAHLSRVLVEERFRHPREGEVFRPYFIAASLGLSVVVCSTLLATQSDSRTQRALLATESAPGHPGARALSRGDAFQSQVTDYIPDPNAARRDRGSPYRLDGGSRCIGSYSSEDLVFCEYGSATAKTRIIVVGDSHAVHWLPTMEEVATERGWRISGLTKSSCAFADEDLRLKASGMDRPYTECRRWGAKAMHWLLREKPDLVILSHSPRHFPANSYQQNDSTIALGTARYARALLAAGIKVAALEHTPWQSQDVPTCMSGPEASVASCSTIEEEALGFGSLNAAARLEPRISLIRTASWFCRNGTCPVVIGGVLVYRDRHHMTATYARTLAPLVGPRIDELL